MAWTPGLGIPVPRVAAADDQNVATAIYTIAGGSVLVTALVGVRTVIQAGGAGNLQFSHSVGPTNLCAAAAITGDAINTIYYITGDTTDPVQISAAALGALMTGRVVATSTTHGANFGCNLILSTGTIRHIHTAAAGTGSTRYLLWYIPLDPAATVVVA